MSRDEARNTTRTEANYILLRARDQHGHLKYPYGPPQSQKQAPVSDREAFNERWRSCGVPEWYLARLWAEKQALAAEAERRRKERAAQLKAKREAQRRRKKRDG